MRLVTIRQRGREEAAVVLPDGVAPVREVYGPSREGADLLSLLESGRYYELKEAYGRGEVRGGASSQISYAPLYRRPRKIWGIGLNYVEHAADLAEKAPSTEPASFLKPDTAIIGPGDPIRIPPQSQRTTAEGELGVVIGRECKDVDEADAPSVVAGFTTIVDMTAEDILEKNPRYLTRSKSFDTFFSFGPELVTVDEVADVDALEVATIHNGREHRRNVVSNMTFRPWWLVAFHSRVMTLLPGDVISTGTPGAVHIRSGDTAGVQITGFRELTNPVA